MLFEKNKSPYGKFGNFVFGLSQILDGVCRVLSFGTLHLAGPMTPLSVSRRQSKNYINRLKSQCDTNKKETS